MRQLATLLALAAALAAAPSGLLAAPQQTLEGTALVLTKDYYTVAPVRERYVVVGSGRSTTTVKVEGEAARQLRTGMKVRVTGRRVAGGGLAGSASAGGTATPSFQATAVQIKAQPRPLPRGRSQRAAPAAGARGLLQAGLPTEQLPVMRSELNTLFLPISFEGCARSTGAAYAKPWYTDAVSWAWHTRAAAAGYTSLRPLPFHCPGLPTQSQPLTLGSGRRENGVWRR